MVSLMALDVYNSKNLRYMHISTMKPQLKIINFYKKRINIYLIHSLSRQAIQGNPFKYDIAFVENLYSPFKEYASM